MDDPAATLESEGEPPNSERHSPVANEKPALVAGRRIMKFSYPSGSTPLDGYTIKRGIGVGGFGEVYFALNDAGKEVALKKIQRNLDVELRGVRQCLNLKHVNLISLWDIRSNEYGESWVVMEYVPGPSLRDVVEANQTGMDEEQVKVWFTSTASGVAYLHEHGIVHRDLKPGNIFCDEDEQVIKIGDYGLSKFISCSRRSGQTESVGTFHYMAPEIGKGVYGKEIDIYALGIILYEMLTGLVPFEGESTQEIIMKHLTADPDVDVVPEEFRKVIAKALRKDPELRYSSVPEMVADLPWPDVAANSQKIISQHAVGPMVHGVPTRISGKRPTEDHPSGEARVERISDDEAKKLPSGKLPPVIISSDDVKVVPEIVFGKLTDTSYRNENRPPTGHASGVRVSHRPTKSEPIRILDDGAVAGAATLPVTASEVVRASMVENEPIAKAVHSGFSNAAQWWNNANISTPVKIILLIVVGIVVIQNSKWLLPLTLVLGLVYLVYFLWHTWKTRPYEEPKPMSAREIEAQQTGLVREWLADRPSTDRMTELVGSLLVGAFACIVLNLLGFALGGGILGDGGFLNTTLEGWAVYAWLTLNCIVGCWALLVCSKNWESSLGNVWIRRGSMAGMGLVIGLIAFYSAASFNLDLTAMATSDFQTRSTENLVFHGVPILPAYLIFFGGLFGILRWWRQTDPVRKTRLSILSVSLCLIWATLFSHLLNVPLVTNCVLAVVVSISVQLASPWIHPASRDEICVEQPSSLV